MCFAGHCHYSKLSEALHISKHHLISGLPIWLCLLMHLNPPHRISGLVDLAGQMYQHNDRSKDLVNESPQHNLAYVAKTDGTDCQAVRKMGDQWQTDCV